MNRLFQGVCSLVLVLFLAACGGGGGGGAPAPVSVSGSVTDTQPGTIQPVAGASVTTVDAATGVSLGAVRTDAAGRYEIRGLPAGATYRLLVEGPGPQYFPASGEVTIVAGAQIRRDFSLAHTGPAQTTASGYESLTTIDGGLTASISTPTALLTGAGTAYGGAVQAYLAPIDVSRIGNGFAHYQEGFVVTSAAPSSIRLAYASAAFDLRDAAGAELAVDPAAPVTLTLPVPLPLQAAAPAAAGLALYRFNTATLAWEAVPAAGLVAVAPTAAIEAYTAQVAEPGLYQVVAETAYVTVGGRLVYDDYAPAIPDNPATTTVNEAVPEHPATAAAGATVYVNAVGAGYQQVVTADADGYFTAYVENPNALGAHGLRLEFVAWGNGIELSNYRDLGVIDLQGLSPATTPVAADYFIPGDATANGIVLGQDGVTLPYVLDTLPAGDEWAPNPVFGPPAGSAATPITLVVDANGNIAPNQIGLMGAAGRLFQHPDPTVVAMLSDLAVNANSFTLNGEVTVDPTSGSQGLQQVAGSFESVHSAPAAGYSTATSIDVSPGTSFPVVVVAKTGTGHYVKASIDSVTGVAGQYDVTLRLAFSLTGGF